MASVQNAPTMGLSLPPNLTQQQVQEVYQVLLNPLSLHHHFTRHAWLLTDSRIEISAYETTESTRD
jgi:hypothetical protein